MFIAGVRTHSHTRAHAHKHTHTKPALSAATTPSFFGSRTSFTERRGWAVFGVLVVNVTAAATAAVGAVAAVGFDVVVPEVPQMAKVLRAAAKSVCVAR